MCLLVKKPMPPGNKIKVWAAEKLSPKTQTNYFYYIAESWQTKEAVKANPYLKVNSDLFPLVEFAAARNFILHTPAARGILPTTATQPLPAAP